MARIFQKKQATIKGFSLMELMVTVAIVGVLTAVAMPSYSGYIDRSRRGDGMDYLLRIAAAQEAYYLANKRYTSSVSDLNIDATSSDKHYRGFLLGTSTGFVAVGLTTGGDTTGRQSDDGILIYRSTGQKQWDCAKNGTYSCDWNDAASK